MSQRKEFGDGFDPRKPHFFKVIVADTLRDKKLMLPSKFVREHGGPLSSPVSIEVPGGMTWQIQMVKARTPNSDNGGTKNVYLVNETWQEFARHHSLKHGHFLVFQYEGGSRFSVAIFDGTNGMEIEYPVVSSSSSSSEFTSVYPFFEVVVTEPHLTKCNMRVPKSFADKYLEKTQMVQLQVGDRKWMVTASRTKGQWEAVRLSAGLTVFAKENSLEAGDVCCFELVGREDGDQLYKVTITKGN